MNGSLYEQIITILTLPPGNLVYHLVLAFSIAGAIPGALTLWQRAGMQAGRRMVIGLGLLLLAQFVLIIDAGLAQFFPGFEAWLPILDRAANAFSLVILIWLWVYPQSSRRADTATLLLSLITLLLTILTGLWWLNQVGISVFNGSSADLIWAGFSLLLAIAGGLLLIVRRPEGFGLGLGMFSLLLVGQVVYLFNPLPIGDFPGVVRLTQIAAYPLLLTLPARFSWGSDPELQGRSGIDPATYDNIKIIAADSDPLEVCQAVTAIVSQALHADWCLLISPPDNNRHITLYCGYGLSQQEKIGNATFNSHLVPVLSEALRQGRPLHLPAEGKIPDLDGFGKILNMPISGSLLSAPIQTRSGEIDKALVLLSSDSERTWSAADQNFLADIATSLMEIFEYKNEYRSQVEKLSQSNANLQKILVENEHLNQEIIEIRSKNISTEQQIKQLQSDLQNALKERGSIKSTRTQEKG